MKPIKAKMNDHQLHMLKNRLSFAYDEIEPMILDKYKAFSLSDLNYLDFDDIMDDINKWQNEINAYASEI